MSNKRKIIIGAFVVGALTLAMVGLANAAPAKPKEREDGDDTLPEEVLPSDLTSDDDDVIAVPPGPDGETGGGPPIVVNTDDDGEPTDIDERLAEEAIATGKTPAEAVAEVVETVTSGQGVSPIAKEETKPKNDPYGTIELARKLLARETLPNWKSDLLADIGAWQARVGLENDQLFGLVSAARMAREVGLLPLIRYWSKGITSKKQAESVYDQQIGAVVNSLQSGLPDSKAHIDALIRSMQREQAQTFGKNPGPQPTLEFAQIVTDEIAANAERGA